MANQTLDVLATSVRDTGYLDRLEMQIAATALSIFNNESTPEAKKMYAKEVYLARRSYAEQWAAGVRVTGDRITKATLSDDDIVAGVEVILNAFAPAEEV